MSTTWADVMGRLGRNDYPVALANAVAEGRLTDPAEVAAGIEAAWTMAEWPLQRLSADLWVGIIDSVITEDQYLHEHTPTPLSELPEFTTLWRGATEEHQAGMSWTDRREHAEWFAGRLGPDGVVWEATVLNTMVLARFSSRSESEWVIDASMFADDDVQPAA
ncbi:hypothetical protein ACWGJ9_11415 [Curtobacterium citreum]